MKKKRGVFFFLGGLWFEMVGVRWDVIYFFKKGFWLVLLEIWGRDSFMGP